MQHATHDAKRSILFQDDRKDIVTAQIEFRSIIELRNTRETTKKRKWENLLTPRKVAYTGAVFSF